MGVGNLGANIVNQNAEFWRGLLVKYMRAVIDREDIAYLERDDGERYQFRLSDAEWDAIEAADAQARAENNEADRLYLERFELDGSEKKSTAPDFHVIGDEVLSFRLPRFERFGEIIDVFSNGAGAFAVKKRSEMGWLWFGRDVRPDWDEAAFTIQPGFHQFIAVGPEKWVHTDFAQWPSEFDAPAQVTPASETAP